MVQALALVNMLFFSIEVAGDLKISGENIRSLDRNDNPLIMGNHIYCALYCGL